MTARKITPALFDPVAERLLLAGLIKYGSDVYFQIVGLSESYFFAPENRLLFAALKKLISEENIEKPDIPSILGMVNQFDTSAIRKFDLGDYVTALSGENILSDSTLVFANRVTRLGLARELRNRLTDSINNLEKVTGDESLTSIISTAEKPIVDFTQTLIYQEDTSSLTSDLQEFLEFLATAQQTSLGIPTGYPLFDAAIGGGLRKPGIHVIGGRAKSNKSYLLLDMGYNISKLKVPVLLLDTELTKDMERVRFLGLLSGLRPQDIEMGKFVKDPQIRKHISDKVNEVAKLPLFYRNVSGMHHTEILSVMRKWIVQHVGFDTDGKTKDCVIILDYIKMMQLEHSGNFAEHQYLGQILTDYHNFCIKYHIPMLSAVQLNREGIHGEDQNVIAGSDRIIHLCTSLSLMKRKSPEDLSVDPPQNGNRKIVVIAARSGPGMEPGEYINLRVDIEKGIIEEGNTNTYNRHNRTESSGIEDVDLETGEIRI